MKQNAIFMIAGAAWGAVLGTLGFIQAGGMAAGFAWLTLFGDDPWPGWAGPMIVVVAATAGLTVFAGCVALGFAAGRRYGRSHGSNAWRARAIATGLTALALFFGGQGLWAQLHREAAVERQRLEEDRITVAFRELVATTHRVKAIDLYWPGGGGDGSATIHTAGQRTGPYVLRWEVRNRSFGRVLLSGRRQLQLTAGLADFQVDIGAEVLVEGYRQLLSRGDANIMVDEPFTLTVTLMPVLDHAAGTALPEREARNLEQGRSDLIDEATAEFPVRFFLYDGELSWEAR